MTEIIRLHELKRSDRVECTRLRIISEGPYMELSYCLVTVNGEPRRLVGLPLRLERRRWKSEIVEEVKKHGIFIRNLFDRVSMTGPFGDF